MKKYTVQVRMINIVQVEVELPNQFCNQQTIEKNAALKAKAQYGEADHIEIMECQEEYQA